MRTKPLGWTALGLALIGLAASVASLVDYFGPTFCAETGCATVRASGWSHPLGVPMPVVGIAYFAAMLGLAVWPSRRARLALAVVGGGWALGLVALQAFVIHAWCKLCLVADPAAIVGAAAVLAGADTVRLTWRRTALMAPAIAAIVVGGVWLGLVGHAPATAMPAGTPAFVAREQRSGEVTIVELVDFECPFCRALQAKLVVATAQHPVRVVRKMVPLPQHAHALAAALAWCCADAQGHGDAMAAALFAADPEQLTPDGCARIAERVGCDPERYRRDLPAMVGRVAADMLDARASGIHELPTIFVGGERVTGSDISTANLVATIERAARL